MYVLAEQAFVHPWVSRASWPSWERLDIELHLILIQCTSSRSALQSSESISCTSIDILSWEFIVGRVTLACSSMSICMELYKDWSENTTRKLMKHWNQSSFLWKLTFVTSKCLTQSYCYLFFFFYLLYKCNAKLVLPKAPTYHICRAAAWINKRNVWTHSSARQPRHYNKSLGGFFLGSNKTFSDKANLYNSANTKSPYRITTSVPTGEIPGSIGSRVTGFHAGEAMPRFPTGWQDHILHVVIVTKPDALRGGRKRYWMCTLTTNCT